MPTLKTQQLQLMKKIKLLSLVSLFLFLNCETEKQKFPIDKRYWTPDDYVSIIRTLKYGYKSDDKLPTFNNPETRIVVEKLTDQQNFKIVLTDTELGLSYKNEVATSFFDRWRDMNGIYDAVDRKDKYIYEKEMLAVWHFGLKLQLYYFKLGNDKIIQESDDPESNATKRNVLSNANTLIKNYTIYLDEINHEKYYSESGLDSYAKGIDLYFEELVELYPNANYENMLRKIDLMAKKSNSEKVKSSLNNLKKNIESKKV